MREFPVTDECLEQFKRRSYEHHGILTAQQAEQEIQERFATYLGPEYGTYLSDVETRVLPEQTAEVLGDPLTPDQQARVAAKVRRRDDGEGT